MDDLETRLRQDKNSINKFDITRTVLQRLNERESNQAIKCRREVIRKVVEWEDFSTAFPEDQAEAKGYVTDVRHVVNVKDSFTRMNLERDRERQERLVKETKEREQLLRKKQEIEKVRREIASLFAQQGTPSQRGVQLESLMNRLFQVYKILVRESFVRTGEKGDGVIEQIDGVIDFEGTLYLVELKWLKGPVDKPDISTHLVRIFGRHSVRGIFISVNGFTKPAIATCKEHLANAPVVLVGLEEIVLALEHEADLAELLRVKVRAAILDKNPWTGSTTFST
ncbi:MAG: restriction endonuclease [Chloroflexi bacterium]|nr:restriction endonuclease [Chloroflexota bacterium]